LGQKVVTVTVVVDDNKLFNFYWGDKMKFFSFFVFLFTFSCNVFAAETKLNLPSLPAEKAQATQVAEEFLPETIQQPIPNFVGMIPAPPTIDAKGYILIDAQNGEILAGNNLDTKLPPASMTKLMALYLYAKALQNGQLHFEDQVRISENAWRMEGSRMFIKVGSTVPAEELINGIVIASGNDATVALAEFLAGSEPAFVEIMNKTAKNLGMFNTNYQDSNGLPALNHYSSPRDMATLAKVWIHDFPQYYPWFSQKWITYNGIKQPNRNRLLWRDSSADGIKTGHTDEAGFCLTASAKRNNARLIAVIMGAAGDEARFSATEALLNYGFRFFETHKLYDANVPLVQQKVWLGKNSTVPLGVKDGLYVSVPIHQYQNLKASLTLDEKLVAPIKKGSVCGMVKVSLNDQPILLAPVVALKDVAKGGVISGIFDRFLMLFHHAK
jgi:serine-type D-Ala-D-Ala carboxypeptidase (penicillin-binding protein 5/6)